MDSVRKEAVTCKIKHLQKRFRASTSRGYSVDVKMFYFTCNHPLKHFCKCFANVFHLYLLKNCNITQRKAIRTELDEKVI